MVEFYTKRMIAKSDIIIEKGFFAKKSLTRLVIY